MATARHLNSDLNTTRNPEVSFGRSIFDGQLDANSLNDAGIDDHLDPEAIKFLNMRAERAEVLFGTDSGISPEVRAILSEREAKKAGWDQESVSRKRVIRGSLLGATVALASGVALFAGLKAIAPDTLMTPMMNVPKDGEKYIIVAGDTEGLLAAKFGYPNSLAFMNAINSQLKSKDDRKQRRLIPGDEIVIPK